MSFAISSRISTAQLRNSTLGSINSTQSALMKVQNQISTGNALSAGSDDPAGAQVAIQLQRALDRRKSYASNLTSANTNLSQVDSSLSDVTTVLQQAITAAQADAGSDVSAAERSSDASVIQALYSQLLSVSNTQINGVYLFGGSATSSPPYVEGASGVSFVGNTGTLQNAVDEKTNISITMDGTRVFGGTANTIAGASLSPDAAADTRLSDLRGAAGNGVNLGPIVVSDGTKSVTVDLSKADTLQDVADAVNATGLATVTLSGDHLVVTGSATATLSITNVGTGSTASDLGIATASPQPAGTPITGGGLSAKVTALTDLSTLLSGSPLDLTQGINISNGVTTKTVSLAGATTVQDVINAINSSGSGARAQINASGSGIDIYNATQGTALTISDPAGGTAASQLGIRSFAGNTKLSSLNNGVGVQDTTGADFTVTDKNGTAYPVDINGAATVQDVLDKINAATGGAVTASLNGTGNGILLTDTTGGTGSLSVASANNSTAATDLGIAGNTTGTTIQGTDANPIRSDGLFDHLLQLTQALQQNNTSAITAAAQKLQDDLVKVNAVRGDNGAKLQEVSHRQDSLTNENLTTNTLLSDIVDTDYTTAATKYSLLQTILQANYTVTSQASKFSLLDYLS